MLTLRMDSGNETVVPTAKSRSLLSELPPLLPLVSKKMKCLSDRLGILLPTHSVKIFTLISMLKVYNTISYRALKSMI